jgi:hypothetical protein
MQIERKLAEGLTLLKTTTNNWDTAKEAVLLRLLEEWRAEAWSLPPNRRLVLVISIESYRRDASLQKQIEELLRKGQNSMPVAAITLPKIERNDAVNWASLPQVRSRCRPDRHEELADGIRAIYTESRNRAMAMKPLAGGLLRLLEQHRETGVAA